MDLEEPLPPWAVRKSDGTYMELGAQLLTKNGRRMGNAFIARIEEHHKLGPLAHVVTDMGNTCQMTKRELEEYFWPPVYIMDVGEALIARLG